MKVSKKPLPNGLKTIDIIEADDAIVEIATDKVDSEVPSEISGKFLKLVNENQVVSVGEPLQS